MQSLPIFDLDPVRRHRRPGDAQAPAGAVSARLRRADRRRVPHHRRGAQRAVARGVPGAGARQLRRRTSAAPSTPRNGRSSPSASRTCGSTHRPTATSDGSAELLRGQEERVRVFFLSTAPDLFAPICEGLARHSLVTPALARRAGKAARLRRRLVRGDQRARRRAVHRAAASFASITTSARRRCRTCWRCVSAIRCSSRCGAAAASSTCRSPSPRTSASSGARSSTIRPARCATWCRTTCCSSCASSRWSRRPPAMRTRCATRS